MSQLTTVLAILVVLIAAAVRLYSIVFAPVSLADSRPQGDVAAEIMRLLSRGNFDAHGQYSDLAIADLARTASSVDDRSAWQSLLEQGVTRIRWQRFDPTGLVVVDAGPDGMPGRAGVDDGANGTVDERGELGATGSDDRCYAIAADQRAELADRAFAVLARGAFLPAAVATIDQPGRGRLFVYGRRPDGTRWEIMRDDDRSDDSRDHYNGAS